MGQRPQPTFSKKVDQKFVFSPEDVKKFLNRLKAGGRSDMRIKELKYCLRRFGKAVGWSCNLEDVVDYLNDRREKIAKRSLIDEIQNIKQFLKDHDVYWIDKIKRPQMPKNKPPVVHREDILEYIDTLSEAPVDEEYFFRAKTAVVLSSVSGMRPWEVYRLEWDEVNLEERYIDLPAEKTKTKQSRFVIFNREARDLLEEVREVFEDQPFSTKMIYVLTSKLDPKPDFKFKYCRKYFSQVWDRKELPTSIKEILLGHFGSVDARSYNGQGYEDLRKVYDRADLRVLD